ncbi:YitT family protein [Tepidibacillus infernus]|uniref:YczE/YyaS/YitT family protein n=1 Tax=Tepidibacillus infernus TaxID=1806172 RepID=UPI003B72FBBA
MSKHEWFIRMIIFFMGIIVMSLGISLIIEANLGVSAWDVLHIGLYKTLGLTVGTWSQIVGIVVIAVSYLMDKKILGVGTVLNMVFVGWFLDLFLYLLPTMKMIIPQIMFLFLGIIFMGMGSGMYITSKLGPGPRDGLMLVLSERFHWGIGKIKTMMEMIALLIGWVLGGPVFIGTVIASVMIGPAMQFFIHLFNVRINKEREKLV